MLDIVLAILFGIWFGRAASRAGRDVLLWAGAGAGLGFATVRVALFGGLLLADAIGSVGPGARIALVIGFWLLGLIVAIAIGTRILPQAGRADLEVELAMREAKAEEPATLRCKECGRRITKREALLQGAIRLDDETCICAGCRNSDAAPG